MGVDASSAEISIATALLQAVVVVIPVWVALTKFMLSEKNGFEDSTIPNFGTQLALLGATSYLSIGIGIIGIYKALKPVSSGLEQAFSGLILWYVVSGLLMAIVILDSLPNSPKSHKQIIRIVGGVLIAAVVVLTIASFAISALVL